MSLYLSQTAFRPLQEKKNVLVFSPAKQQMCEHNFFLKFFFGSFTP